MLTWAKLSSRCYITLAEYTMVFVLFHKYEVKEFINRKERMIDLAYDL